MAFRAWRSRRALFSRRKSLVGAIAIAKVEQGQLDEKPLRRWLDLALTRPDVRALFNL